LLTKKLVLSGSDKPTPLQEGPKPIEITRDPSQSRGTKQGVRKQRPIRRGASKVTAAPERRPKREATFLRLLGSQEKLSE